MTVRRCVCRELPFRVATGWQMLVGRPEVAVWVERELQALVLQADIGLIHSVVSSAMHAAPQVKNYILCSNLMPMA